MKQIFLILKSLYITSLIAVLFIPHSSVFIPTESSSYDCCWVDERMITNPLWLTIYLFYILSIAYYFFFKQWKWIKICLLIVTSMYIFLSYLGIAFVLPDYKALDGAYGIFMLNIYLVAFLLLEKKLLKWIKLSV